MNFGSDECTKISLVCTSLLSQAVLKHVVSKDFIFKKSVQGIGSVSAKNEEIYGIAWHIKNFSCHVTLTI